METLINSYPNRNIPYGWKLIPTGRYGQKLVQDPDQQQVIKYMLFLKQHNISCLKIANELNLHGIKTKRGKVWYSRTVNKIIQDNTVAAR